MSELTMKLSASDTGRYITGNVSSSSKLGRMDLGNIRKTISYSIGVITYNTNVDAAEFFRNVPVADEVIEEGSELDLLAQEAEEYLRRRRELRKAAE